MKKFRAWWMEQEVMCDVDVISFSEGAITVSNENTTYQHLGLNEVELMQSTGLKDKNRKEVFGGDIVKLSWTVYDKEELFLVRTKPGRAPRIDNVTKGKELWLRHKDCEVVGNKFENIDLLEGMEWTN